MKFKEWLKEALGNCLAFLIYFFLITPTLPIVAIVFLLLAIHLSWWWLIGTGICLVIFGGLWACYLIDQYFF